MKKKLIAAGAGLCGVLTVGILSQVAPPASPPVKLDGFVPAGPLLYLEAKNFATLLDRWQNSEERQRRLKSASLDAFARSHLYLRLSEAAGNYGKAGEVAPDYSMLQSIAGSESALALYDIGELQFLYLTHLPSAKAVETALWRSRARFTPRKAGGVDFYVRQDAEGRVVAFAAVNDIFLVATREELIGGALELMAGTRRNKMMDERWFAQPIHGAGVPGDFRLVMDTSALCDSPHFRSYWIQHNVAKIRQYSSAISDVYLSPGSIREERLLFRTVDGAESAGDSQPLADALRLVPDDAGFYQGWAAPEAGKVSALLQSKLLDPTVAGPERSPDEAPPAPRAAAAVGSEADLDTRIDEPAMADAGGKLLPEALQRLVGAERVVAAVQVEQSRKAADGIFIGTDRALVVVRPSAWETEPAKEAIVAAVEDMWTTSRLGAGWAEVQHDGQRYFAWNGLVPLVLAVDGNRMIVANSAQLLERMLARRNAPPPAASGIYAAGFGHARERGNFAAWMRQLTNGRAPARPTPGAAPEFLSENLVSLSDTLSRIQSARIVVAEQGEATRQTLTYELGR